MRGGIWCRGVGVGLWHSILFGVMVGGIQSKFLSSDLPLSLAIVKPKVIQSNFSLIIALRPSAEPNLVISHRIQVILAR
jgi:hypothetical protein